MNIIRILEMYNQAKLKEYDVFRSTNNEYYDLIYINNEICYLDEHDNTEVLTFAEIANLINDNVIYIKDNG